jgi:predicted RNase H-like nuclease (RuvC/YqgF family)
MVDDLGLAAQFQRADEEAERLRQEHGTGGATARELYRQLLAFLEKRCPGVFLQLNGKTLHDLLRRGSSVVSGEVLREYREKASLRMFSKPDLPIPLEAQEPLMDAVAHIWETSYFVAKRELDEVAEIRNQAFRQEIEQLRMHLESQSAELESIRASRTQTESDNHLLRERLEETTENFLAACVDRERLEKRCEELQAAQRRDLDAFAIRVKELTALSARAWELVEARADPSGSKPGAQG